MKHFLFLFLFCIMSSCVSHQKRNNENKGYDFYLEIKQTVYGGWIDYTYILTDNEIFIFKRYVAKNGIYRIDEIYSKKIKSEEKLRELRTKSEKLFDLKSEYITPMLGGLGWDIKIVSKDVRKKIKIENTTVKEVELLFETFNTLIPKKHPKLHKNFIFSDN